MPDIAAAPATPGSAPLDRIAAALERIAESQEVLARVAIEHAAAEEGETDEAADPPDELDEAAAAAMPAVLPPALELSRLSDLS